MDPNSKLWNERHKRLHQAFRQPGKQATAIDLFLR